MLMFHLGPPRRVAKSTIISRTPRTAAQPWSWLLVRYLTTNGEQPKWRLLVISQLTPSTRRLAAKFLLVRGWEGASCRSQGKERRGGSQFGVPPECYPPVLGAPSDAGTFHPSFTHATDTYQRSFRQTSSEFYPSSSDSRPRKRGALLLKCDVLPIELSSSLCTLYVSCFLDILPHHSIITPAVGSCINYISQWLGRYAHGVKQV